MTGKSNQPSTKRIPIRTCVVCREQAGKRTLIRLVRGEQGIVADPTGKAHGRGAYLCDKPTCWEKAASTDILAKALRTSLTDTDRVYLRAARAHYARQERAGGPQAEPQP